MYGYKIFHPKQMEVLINNARRGTHSNAYIFEGAAGMYKHEAARLFANALVCDNQPYAPCGECKSCAMARANTHPDIITIPHDTGKDGKLKKTIGIDGMRKYSADTLVSPFSSRKKVYIIPDGENWTVEGQNALLKTLEEPPEYVVFIIIVPTTEVLLPTIISRSEIISFNPVSTELLSKYIEKTYPNDIHRVNFLCSYSNGTPGEVDRLIADAEFEVRREQTLELLEKLLSHSAQAAFELADYMDANNAYAADIMELWISYLHDLVKILSGANNRVTNADKTDKLRKMSQLCELSDCTSLLKRLVTGKKMLDKYVKLRAIMLYIALKE